MEFRTGDEVVHRAYGVGNVLRHEKQQVAGGEPRWYYVLAIGPSTVWVPMHADGATSLRAVTSKQELDQCRTILKGRPSVLDRDHNKRRLEVKTRITQGSFRVLCEVTRDLTALGWQRRISEADAALLQKVRDTVGREWAVAAGLPLADALQEIDDLLLAGQKNYKV